MIVPDRILRRIEEAQDWRVRARALLEALAELEDGRRGRRAAIIRDVASRTTMTHSAVANLMAVALWLRDHGPDWLDPRGPELPFGHVQALQLLWRADETRARELAPEVLDGRWSVAGLRAEAERPGSGTRKRTRLATVVPLSQIKGPHELEQGGMTEKVRRRRRENLETALREKFGKDRPDPASDVGKPNAALIRRVADLVIEAETEPPILLYLPVLDSHAALRPTYDIAARGMLLRALGRAVIVLDGEDEGRAEEIAGVLALAEATDVYLLLVRFGRGQRVNLRELDVERA